MYTALKSANWLMQWIKPVTAAIILAIFLFGPGRERVGAIAYPSRCQRECSTAGSWCIKAEMYRCGTSDVEVNQYCNTGFYIGPSYACPAGCVCGVYAAKQCAGCGTGCNNCIKVESCYTPVPSATPTSVPNTNIYGYHDQYSGIQPAANCRAQGWAADPDDRSVSVVYRAYVDNVLVTDATHPSGEFPANQFRQDLLDAYNNSVPPGTSGCKTGYCSFNLDLTSVTTGKITLSNNPHTVRVEARDLQSNGWVQLRNTNKSLTCVQAPPVCYIESGPTSVNTGLSATYKVVSTNAVDVGLYRTPADVQCWNTTLSPTCMGSQFDGLPGASDPSGSLGSISFPLGGSSPGKKYYVTCAASRPDAFCAGNPFCRLDSGGNWSCSPWFDCQNSPTVSPYCSTTPGSTTDCLIVNVSDATGTIILKTYQTDPVNPQCDTGSALDLTNIIYTLTRSADSQVQTGVVSPASTATWSNIRALPDNYSLSVGTKASHTIAKSCFKVNGVVQAVGSFSANLNPGDTLEWDIGLVPAVPWVQTGGGDVYVGKQLNSKIPSDSHFFSGVGLGGFPGLVNYGGSGSPLETSIRQRLSTTKWMSKEVYPQESLYNKYYTKLWSLAEVSDYTDGKNPKCLTNPDVCIIRTPANTDISQTEAWNLAAADNKRTILLIDGNLNINNSVQVKKNEGFFAAIVKGNITINPNLGKLPGNYADSTPDLQGIFIAGGRLDTGGGSNKLVLNGMFLANQFLLTRRLTDPNNSTTPAEVFTYNPQFLLTMPGEMTDVKTQWQEVSY